MSTAIIPEVLDVEILENSPMTEAEDKELVIVKTAITAAYADKLERDLAIGAGLLKIFRQKLYRGKEGGRTWEQWLKEYDFFEKWYQQSPRERGEYPGYYAPVLTQVSQL